MANNFSIEQAREKLAIKTGIPSGEFVFHGISNIDDFVRYEFTKGFDREIIYTVLSPEEVDDLEEHCPIDSAP